VYFVDMGHLPFVVACAGGTRGSRLISSPIVYSPQSSEKPCSTQCATISANPPETRPNKALELTGRRLVGLPRLRAGGRPVRGGLGGRPPDGAWYLHGRPAAQCLVR
jgi:hypothetical protein